MKRVEYVSLSRLLVAAGYADKTLVAGQDVDFEFTALGQTRLRELYSHLASLPEPGSVGRVAAILELAAEMKPFSPSGGEIEAFVAVCLACRKQGMFR